jgi:hypothetical protein
MREIDRGHIEETSLILDRRKCVHDVSGFIQTYLASHYTFVIHFQQDQVDVSMLSEVCHLLLAPP